jgi:transposase InsO family protein
MYAQVRNIIARCEQCDRVKTSFSSQQLTLFPLPIQSMFYCWSCDLVGELLLNSKGNVYIMVMIDHFSKWVELVALPDKSSHNISQTFLQQVLSRFGASVKCLTDQGSKFKGEFQDLLDNAFINHHRTSRDHPQANGLVERMVQTYKKGLRKICLTGNKEDWDLALPYIAMGYRTSKHTFLSHFAPYFLLFARHPIPPFFHYCSNRPSCGLGFPIPLG